MDQWKLVKGFLLDNWCYDGEGEDGPDDADRCIKEIFDMMAENAKLKAGKP